MFNEKIIENLFKQTNFRINNDFGDSVLRKNIIIFNIRKNY